MVWDMAWVEEAAVAEEDMVVGEAVDADFMAEALDCREDGKNQ